MANGIEVAQAYVTIIPSMRGIQGEISDALDADKIGDDAGKEMGSGIGSGLSAAKVALGGILAELAMSAVSTFKEKFTDGITQSDALQKFGSTMEFAGFDTGEIATVRDAMKDYADQTVYDLGEVMDTTAKLAANGVKDYDTLVQAAGNLNAAAGGNSESFGYFANAITQVNGAGKLMSQDWNQIVNALPGASGAIQNELKEMGAWDESMGSFKDAMAAGEISSEEFNEALTHLGMTDVAKEAATSTTTFEGAVGQLDAAVTNTMQSIYDSLNEDGRVTDAINGIASAFEAAAPVVEDVASAFGDFVEFISPALPIIAGIVAGIAAASGIVAVIGAISSAVGFLTTVVIPAIGMIGSIPGLIAVIVSVLGGPITIIGAIIGAIVAFLATNEEARNKVIEVWTAIKDAVVNFALGMANTVMNKFNALKTNVIRIFNAVKTTVTNVWNGIKSAVTTVVGAVVSVVTSRFNALKSTVSAIFNGVKAAITNPIQAAKDAVSGAIEAIKSIINGAHLELPKFKLPHFNINGGKLPWGIGGKGSPPSISVDWYARGGFVDGAQLVGVGERGGEFIWPSYAPYLDQYADALASRIGGGDIYVNGTVNDTPQVRAITKDYLVQLSRLGAI